MQLFFFPGKLKWSFHPSCLGNAVRVGFLLADRTITTKLSRMMIDINLPEHNLSDAMKLKLVLDFFDNQVPDIANRLRELSAIVRGVEMQKRKDKKMLYALKKFEENLALNYGIFKDCLLRSLRPYNLLPLREVLNDAAVRNYLYNDSQTESSHREFTPLSQILQMQGDKADQQNGVEDVIFILPFEFFNPDRLPVHAGSIAQALPEEQALEADEEAVWIEPLLRFPNLSAMQAEEMRAVRHQLRAPGEALRKAMDNWLSDCHHQRHSVRARARSFKEVIRPAATTVQSIIDEDKTLTAHQLAFAAEENSSVMIFAAEMPLRVLWDYYEKEEVVPQETLDKLRAVWDTEGLRRFPMLLIGPAGATADLVATTTRQAPLSAAADTTQPQEENPASARKSIDLS